MFFPFAVVGQCFYRIAAVLLSAAKEDVSLFRQIDWQEAEGRYELSLILSFTDVSNAKKNYRTVPSAI